MKTAEVVLKLDVAQATNLVLLSQWAQKESKNWRILHAAKMVGILGQRVHEVLGEPVPTQPRLKVIRGDKL